MLIDVSLSAASFYHVSISVNENHAAVYAVRIFVTDFLRLRYSVCSVNIHENAC